MEDEEGDNRLPRDGRRGDLLQRFCRRASLKARVVEQGLTLICGCCRRHCGIQIVKKVEAVGRRLRRACDGGGRGGWRNGDLKRKKPGSVLFEGVPVELIYVCTIGSPW